MEKGKEKGEGKRRRRREGGRRKEEKERRGRERRREERKKKEKENLGIPCASQCKPRGCRTKKAQDIGICH